MGKRFGALGVVLAAVVLVVGLVSPAVGAAAGASYRVLRPGGAQPQW